MVASGYQKALLHWVLGSKFLTPVSDLGSSWPSCLDIFDLYVFILFQVFFFSFNLLFTNKISFYICCYFNLTSRNCNSETQHGNTFTQR